MQDNENKLQSEINDHISLSKEWMSHHTKILSDIVENQQNMSKILNLIFANEVSRDQELIKYAHLAQYLLILGDNIESLYDELNSLEKLLAFIHAKSILHSTFSINSLAGMINRLRSLYSKDEILDLECRDYFDIIRLGSYYKDKLVVIVIMIPVFMPETTTLYRLSVIPNKNHEILIPTLPYIALQGTVSMYMEAECPKIKSWYLCERASQHYVSDHPDCIQHLILQQKLLPSCQLITITLKKAALEQLDDRHYTLNFPEPTKVQISCGQEKYEILQGSYLASLPLNCKIKTPEFTITNMNDHIKGHVLKIINLSIEKGPIPNKITPLVSHTTDLRSLQDVNMKISLQHPEKLNPLPNESIYHTTIPVYTIILLGVGALITGFTYRRLCSRYLRTSNTEEPTLEEVNAGSQPKSPREGGANIDPASISATFARALAK